jgi:hypothetical protein
LEAGEWLIPAGRMKMGREHVVPLSVIELQLAHLEKNKTKAAYKRAERLTERRAMMHAWGRFLDGLRVGAKVATIRRA